MEPDTKAVPWTLSAGPGARSPQRVIQAHVQVIAAVVERGDVVKVLRITRQVRERNIVQQAQRDGTDVLPRNYVVRERLSGCRVEDPDG